MGKSLYGFLCIIPQVLSRVPGGWCTAACWVRSFIGFHSHVIGVLLSLIGWRWHRLGLTVRKLMRFKPVYACILQHSITEQDSGDVFPFPYDCKSNDHQDQQAAGISSGER